MHVITVKNIHVKNKGMSEQKQTTRSCTNCKDKPTYQELLRRYNQLLSNQQRSKQMQEITVYATKEYDLLGFLSSQGFTTEVVGEEVFKITREDELPVLLAHNDGSLYFEVDIGGVLDILATPKGAGVLTQFLDLNTEVLPVSFGINSTNPADPRLVLVESRVTGDLSDRELLSVFDALELAVDKAELLLTSE